MLICVIANVKNSQGLSLIENSPFTTTLLNYAKTLVEKLVRVTPYINISKRSTLMNNFFTLLFCRLIWMCYSRTKNREITDFINVLHKLFIRKNSCPLKSYQRKIISVFIYHRSLRHCAIEINKIRNSSSPILIQKHLS